MRVRSPVFVGRSRELELLLGWLNDAWGGMPRVVALAGEAGVGKTRLVDEIGTRAREQNFTVLLGAATDFGAGGLPFGALAEALRPALRTRGGLPALLEEVYDGDRLTQARVYERLLSFLEQLSRQRPLLLLLEDIHWADASTREFVAFLARNLGTARVLVVATYRTDDVGRDHPLRRYLIELRRGRVEHVVLDRFDRGELREQAAAIRGADISDELLDRLYARSQGNAFFSEELLAAGDDPQTPEALPPGLRETMLARVDRLGDDARDVIAPASVAGIFDEDLLAALVSWPQDRLSRALREALESGLIERLPDGGFDFRHALLREAIYDDLLPSERARMHRLIAERLSARLDTATAEPWILAGVAHHWDLAGEPRQALVSSWIAGQAAERGYAYADASRLYLRVADLWPMLPDAAEMLRRSGSPPSDDMLTLADVLTAAAESTEAYNEVGALSRWQTVAANIDRTRDPDRYAIVQDRIGTLAREVSEEKVAADADMALMAVVDAVSSRARAQMLVGQAYGSLVRGRFQRSLEQSLEALRLALDGGSSDERFGALINAARASGYLGRLDDAHEMFERARSEARASGSTLNLATADKWEGDLLQAAARFDEAVVALRRAEMGLHEVGHAADAYHAAAIRAQALHRAGRWGEADRDTDLARLTETMRWARVVRAYLLVGRGRFGEAERLIADSGQFVAASNSGGGAGPWYSARAEMQLWNGRPAEALAIVEDGLPVVGPDVRWIGELCMLGARAAADLGDENKARAITQSLQGEARRAITDGTVFEPELRGWLATAAAETERAASRSEGRLWQDAVERWMDIPELYPAAYARYRHAEAVGAIDRASAVDSLVQAQRIAAELGAEPLARAIDALARRVRLRLAGTASETRGNYGLTSREREVLAMLTQGASDRDIAERLFISAKTASVHVSNVKAKLGVSTRIEAATIGVRLGVTADP